MQTRKYWHSFLVWKLHWRKYIRIHTHLYTRIPPPLPIDSTSFILSLYLFFFWKMWKRQSPMGGGLSSPLIITDFVLFRPYSLPGLYACVTLRHTILTLYKNSVDFFLSNRPYLWFSLYANTFFYDSASTMVGNIFSLLCNSSLLKKWMFEKYLL